MMLTLARCLQDARPLNSFLVSAWRANLEDHLLGTFRAEACSFPECFSVQVFERDSKAYHGAMLRTGVVFTPAIKAPAKHRGLLQDSCLVGPVGLSRVCVSQNKSWPQASPSLGFNVPRTF